MKPEELFIPSKAQIHFDVCKGMMFFKLKYNRHYTKLRWDVKHDTIKGIK